MFEITPEYFSPEEFIDNHSSLGGLHNQRLVEVLKGALAIIPLIKNKYSEEQSDIPIRISNSESLSAESNPYSIVISSGMIKHCIAAPCMPIDEICPALPIENFDYNAMAATALAWIIAHEYFHIVRRHNEVAIAARDLPGRPYANSIDNALEHDADLMATAALYRLTQMRLGNAIHDLDVRRITVHGIFLTLRTFPQESADNIHSAMPERLFQIYQKLVQVTKGGSEKVSASGLTDYSVERVIPILHAFAQCERYFQLLGGENEPSLDIQFAEFCNNKDAPAVVKSWQWISPVVERITGTKSDNRNHKGLNINRVCVFCGANNPIGVPVFAPWISEKLNIGRGKQLLTDMAHSISESDNNTIFIKQPYLRDSALGSDNIDRICAACINDWLAPLDLATRPLIDSLIDGKVISIAKDEAKRISIYMCAIAVLHEYTDPNPDNRCIPENHKRLLRKNRIPSNWAVAIRPMEKNVNYGIRTHHARIENRPSHTICNIHLGCFYVQIVCFINCNYPLHFDKSKFISTHPFKGQSNVGQIEKLSLSNREEAFNNLHFCILNWTSEKAIELMVKNKKTQ
ncbi:MULTISPECIES: hypothetical protein [Pseudomonas]|uniref:hypothetical protein n=1 Tax=Pseudomonas TaxID=286 RepID=UPI0008761BDD|nr:MULTISPECIES: hypothetical protein [Pseudomonas]TFA84549.1 hypothetical protein F638_2159 [Pseudomonas sp. LAIL14HWK12:I2]SCZ29788.1 hypothetical protein SAMN03159313_2825 [Pseudomonas sp. NFIX46]SDB26804.1 hypothetical protein SAMN03097715_02029 [Pseudomonas putida]SFQ93180.1 hypothetical protein SAMN03159312_5418 [Pseudomonas sp. NFIX49]